MPIKKIKISELPDAESLIGLTTIGVDKQNKSVKIGLDFLKKAADEAKVAAAEADKARDRLREELSLKKGIATGAMMGSGLFKSDNPLLLSKDSLTTELLFETPSTLPGQTITFYNEGVKGVVGYGLCINYTSTGRIRVVFRGLRVADRIMPPNSLCHIIVSYQKDGDITAAINGTLETTHAPNYVYDHNPTIIVLGGTEMDNENNTFPKINFIAARRYNFAFNEEQILLTWNNGHPEEWRVPNVWRNRQPSDPGCILDLIPENLYPTVWCDASGQHIDFPYFPGEGNAAEVILSNQQVGFPERRYNSGPPTAIPDFIGQEYIDLLNRKTYKAYGTMSANDWGLI